MRRNWIIAFSALTMLSLDYWWWDARVILAPLGLPIWIYYFGGLQVVLAVALWWVGRWYVEDRDAGTDETGSQ